MDWRKKAILLERRGEMNQIIQNCLFLLPVEKSGLKAFNKTETAVYKTDRSMMRLCEEKVGWGQEPAKNAQLKY